MRKDDVKLLDTKIWNAETRHRNDCRKKGVVGEGGTENHRRKKKKKNLTKCCCMCTLRN